MALIPLIPWLNSSMQPIYSESSNTDIVEIELMII